MDSNKLSLTSHHSVMDGWSVQVLLAELAASYDAALMGSRPALPPLQCQYTDFFPLASQPDGRRRMGPPGMVYISW